MQLTKSNHFEDNSIFGEPLLLHDPPSPQSQPFSRQNPLPHHSSSNEESPPQREVPLLLQPYDNNQLRFYQEFKKIYTVAHHLTLEKHRQITLMQTLNKRIKTLEDRMSQTGQKKTPTRDQISEENRTKRSRRTAQEIEKKFKCQVAYCERLYGSEGSLQQHIKLKHPELYHRSQSDQSALREVESSL